MPKTASSLKCLNTQTWPEGEKRCSRNILGRQKPLLNFSCSYFSLVRLWGLSLCSSYCRTVFFHWRFCLIGCYFPRIWIQGKVTMKNLICPEPVIMERKTSRDHIKPFFSAINHNAWSTALHRSWLLGLGPISQGHDVRWPERKSVWAAPSYLRFTTCADWSRQIAAVVKPLFVQVGSFTLYWAVF